MVMAMCGVCGGTIVGGKEHKCPPYPFNVIMTDEDKERIKNS
jgi:hypothetical protein